MSHNGHSNNHLFIMLLGCGLMILALAVFKDRIPDGWLFAIVLGACVIPHLFMMRGKHHHEDSQSPITPTPDDKTPAHKEDGVPPRKGGGCCH